jgi:hypothetical protein
VLVVLVEDAVTAKRRAILRKEQNLWFQIMVLYIYDRLRRIGWRMNWYGKRQEEQYGVVVVVVVVDVLSR